MHSIRCHLKLILIQPDPYALVEDMPAGPTSNIEPECYTERVAEAHRIALSAPRSEEQATAILKSLKDRFAESTANIIVDPLDVESRSPCLVSKCYKTWVWASLECTLMKDTAW